MSEKKPITRRDITLVRAEYEQKIQHCFREKWRLIGSSTVIPIGTSVFVEVVSPILNIPVGEPIASTFRIASGFIAGVALPFWVHAFYEAKKLETERDEELRRINHP